MSYRLCWGETVVPLEPATVDLVNMHHIEDLGDEALEPEGFLLVERKGIMPRPWIEEGLGWVPAGGSLIVPRYLCCARSARASIATKLRCFANPTLSWPFKFVGAWSSSRTIRKEHRKKS